MSQRTYENPGDCVKCGYPYAEIEWVKGMTQKDSGAMIAYCMHCRYSWKVLAKDEIA